MTINGHQIKNFIKHFFTAKRNGHCVHSPFAYLLCEEVFYNSQGFYDFNELGLIRKRLLANNTMLEIQDFGAGSKTFKGTNRRIKDIATKGISTQKQSELLYRLVNFLKCHNCIELGTSLGLNTLYLAKANTSAMVISIEGSKSLSDFAEQLAGKNGVTNSQFTHSLFDEALPEALQKISELDLFYVDGNHTYEATLNYFKLALEKKQDSSTFIFDDIYWSQEMTKAWIEIKNHPAVTLSIDTFYFGIVFFKKEIKEKVDLKFYV
jgi:predicted O-methyltransferase YrrM